MLGTTKVVERGSHGPFTIGEDKAVSAQTLRQLGLWPPRAIAPHRPWLDSPDFAELERVFGADEGIMVGFGVASSFPTRLEFEGDTLVAYWPVETPKTWSNPNPGYDEAEEAILAFQDRIAIGMSRENVFRSVAQSGQEIGTAVRGHVAGERRFRDLPFAEREVDQGYADFVFGKSGWAFRGLKDAVWYRFFREPHTSLVKLFFDEGTLVRIEHYQTPFELP
ncbi:hypothetical protein [uncultured Sulfitobacter sp.]|uniref:hypothetical protein n=1 Tax=uncultured Sulfitobacter sp. TaxID=191468 RepID=UPI00261FE8E0|nr:hypothetical protein [uncultured Sulfitobacter sp.]